MFGKDISPNRLWFQHEGQDLQISVIGSKQEVILHNWYASPSERPGDIMAGDGHRLIDSDVEHLVQAMAAFAPPEPATCVGSQLALIGKQDPWWLSRVFITILLSHY
ncbi:hypothetical protein [Photorhabdus viridis]|uniref:hypothetical protein n=1 Tax=Photorhabdus viridis TaxID=3163327 RepID=UPI0033069FF8